eukprot:3790014-Ditylum_brightwellii.AAC.1
MNQYLLEHHKKYFGQAKETPLVSEQLGKEIGYTGEGPVAQALKQGRANIEEIETDAYTKDFLQELQHKQSDLPK